MKSFLGKILENKKREIKKMRSGERNFYQNLFDVDKGKISLIAEIKIKSPSEGILGKSNTISELANDYEIGGAKAISVVTDKKYFGGEIKYLTKIKNAVKLPILMKDFIIDPLQIYQAKLAGADAVLLIVKILSRVKVNKFVDLCIELGMEPVVEICDKKELKIALESKTGIIAVNARDLTDFSVNISRACEVIKLIPLYILAIGFSGVKSKKEVEEYKKAGAKAVLVGTSLMMVKNKKKFLKDLMI